MSPGHVPRRRRVLSVARLSVLVLASVAQSGSTSAATGCPTPHPAFAYVDADNDGCYTAGTDSTSVDADLKAPTFVGPAGTSLVIPHTLVLPDQANPHWAVDNDVWIDGRVGGPSELVVESGGTTHINGSIKMEARGDGYEGDTTIGCETGCGPVVIADRAQVTANGYVTIYDASIGDDVRIVARCAPGGDPSCYAWLDLARPSSIGDRFRVRSPGGVMIRDGTTPLAIGDDVTMKTRSVFTDGGTLSFDIDLNAPAGLTIGANARLRAGGTVWLGGWPVAGVPSGPLVIGAGAKVSGTGVGHFFYGPSIDIGADTLIRAKFEIDSAQLMPLRFVANGPIDVASGVRIYGGDILIDAGTGSLSLDGTTITSGSRSQNIELRGGSVTVGAGSLLTKSRVDWGPIVVSAASAVSIVSSTLNGQGLEVSVSDPAATIAFTDDDANGGPGTVARFSAPSGGSCDLTGSKLVGMTLDTSQCGSVTGP